MWVLFSISFLYEWQIKDGSFSIQFHVLGAIPSRSPAFDVAQYDHSIEGALKIRSIFSINVRLWIKFILGQFEWFPSIGLPDQQIQKNQLKNSM